MAQTILVFDSGLGGLTVHAELRSQMPDARFVYVADDEAFPYGRLTAEACSARVLAVVGAAIARFQPALAVIACNTASTVALPALREAFAVPFVGTVPAVKPAAAMSRTKTISILGTPGTVAREYTHDLIIQHAADCRVTLVGAPQLARLAESHLRGETVTDRDVLAEIEPCFREKDGLRTDAVALACTHYPLLLDIYRKIAPWEVAWIDPAPAIARRAASLLAASVGRDPLKDRINGFADRIRQSAEVSENVAFLSSGSVMPPALAKVFADRGLRASVGFAKPFALPSA
jgi:glutamate racemase